MGANLEHRQRLLDGMARAVGDKGYAATTIADIVAAAAVSRRTFYEHFATKAECLVALYEHACLQGLDVLARGIGAALPWPAQVEQALAAYLGWMAKNPALMRTLSFEILVLGEDALAVRRRVHAAMVDFIVATVQRDDAGHRPSRALAMAVVGGIQELVLEQIERGDFARLPALAPVAAELARRVLAPAAVNPRASAPAPSRSTGRARARTAPRTARP